MKKPLLFLLFLQFTVFVFAQTYTAKIIGVTDGDTVSILFNNKRQVIRLAHIDTPERNQPFGYKAKQFVSDRIFGKEVTVVIADRPDRNGRWIAEIFYKNQNINKELVRNGLAWHFKRYSKNMNYAELEIQARKKKIGLWQESNPVEPWNWRNYKKRQNALLKKAS